MRRGIRAVGAAAVTLLALSACGAVDHTPTDNDTAKAGSSRSPSTAHTSGASESPKSQRAGDDRSTSPLAIGRLT
jgi:hypothetical protein